jgi:arginyl-tRNA synthetase
MTVDPIEALRPCFADALARAFGPEHAATDPLVRRSDRADLQANVAMSLAKKLGKPPRAVAEALAAALAASPSAEGLLAKVEIAGPGFLNLTLTDALLERSLTEALSDDRLGVPTSPSPERVVIDYSAPNVAKEMHVGHLRSTVIGDSLARVLEHRGHTVLRQNHIGDWGTPFGMLIEHMVELGEDAASAEVSVGELSSFYKAARQKFDARPEFAERSRRRVVSLQAGEPETRRLWGLLVALSTRYFEAVYDKLGVTLRARDLCGESFYNPLLSPLCDELSSSTQTRADGAPLVREDDGALCVFPTGFSNKSHEPLPLIIKKKDGGFGYATTDLAAIRHRLHTLGATRLLYVVGAPQEQHLGMVFAAARELGWLAPPARAEHVAFGSVLGTDKRMFRSRSGDTVRLVDLLDEAVARALAVVRDKAPELGDEAQGEVARKVGIGAIKYADLSSDRVKDYVFDLDRMLSFEGNTAPYLQYACARVRSIFRKAGRAPTPGPITLTGGEGAAAERALALTLLAFGSTIASVESSLEPHRLCTYLYELATAFSSFYDKCPIVKADEPVRSARLALAWLTARTLEAGLSLLGIEAPEQM